MNNGNPKIPVLVFQADVLGSLQVYGYHTLEEALINAPLKEYFWRNKAAPRGFGPFKSIAETMNHYTMIIKSTKSERLKLVSQAKLIRVDFLNKKRI